MKALILAAGRGTRLGPLTNTIPKPLLPIKDKPFLEYLINFLKNKGTKKIVIAIGYRGQKIKKYFTTGKRQGVAIQYSAENGRYLSGTGGAVKKAKNKLKNDDFLVLNGDSFVDVDIKKIYDFHKKNKSLVTMVAVQLKNVERYGSLSISAKNKLLAFKEKGKKGAGFINGGIYVFNNKIFKYFPQTRFVSLEKDIFPRILNQITIYKSHGYFIDIGLPADYKRAQKELPKL